MKARKPNKDEERWLRLIRQLGCIACIVAGRIAPWTVPEDYTAIHHIDGTQKPGAHKKTLPLCPGCHQKNSDARHVNKRKFEETYGTEVELLEKVESFVL